MNPPRGELEDLYQKPNSYQPQYTQEHISDRLSQPSILVSIFALILTALYSVYGASIIPRRIQARSAPELAWNIVVFLIPLHVLAAIDNWLHPSLFQIPMLQPRSTTHAAKSELLKKILGMDRQGGIMWSVSSAGRRGFSSVSGAMMSFKRSPDGPPGLGNLDNSCYQNSILQGLASLKPFPRYLTEPVSDPELDRRKVGATDTLRNLIADLNDTSNFGKTLWTPSSLKSMSTWQQQDAQEYFSKLLDEIDREISKAAKANHKVPGLETEPVGDDTATSQHSDDSGYQSLFSASKLGSETKSLRNPLEGLAAQRVACTQCGYSEGLSMIPFNCMTLSLGTGSSEHDLFEQLDQYTHIEPIEGVECGKCTLLKAQRLLTTLLERARETNATEERLREPLSRLASVEEALEDDDFDDKTLTQKCRFPPQFKVSSTKTKQVVIARPPQSLVIHMNRSVFDETTGFMYKNSAAVRFPSILDLGPWCLGSAGSKSGRAPPSADEKEVGKTTTAATQDHAADEEQWQLDPKTSMIAGDKQKSKMTGPLYELRAVVTHYGRHENGHYICYRKYPRSAPPTTGLVKDVTDAVDGDEAAEEDKRPESPPETKQDLPADDSDDENDMEWWRLSDENVTKVDEEIVLAQGGVFMLFYDCVDPSSVLASEVDARGEALKAELMAEVKREATKEVNGTEKEAPQSISSPLTRHDRPLVTGADNLKQPESVPLPAGDDEDLL